MTPKVIDAQKWSKKKTILDAEKVREIRYDGDIVLKWMAYKTENAVFCFVPFPDLFSRYWMFSLHHVKKNEWKVGYARSYKTVSDAEKRALILWKKEKNNGTRRSHP